MTKRLDLIEGFRRVLKDCGTDAEKFIHIERFWEDEEILNAKRASLEKHIQQAYLPGFRFLNNKHFIWHFYTRDDPFLILRGRTPETYFETWIRSIMVPSALHYHSELAASFRVADQRYRRRLIASRTWGANWEWPERVARVISTPGVLSSTSDVTSINKRSIYRWAANVSRHRSERLRSDPPSSWRIKAISFGGDFAFRYGRRDDHGKPPRSGPDAPRYFETWEWQDHDGIEPPYCTEWTFHAPAMFELWQRPWTSKRHSRRATARQR